MIIIKLKRRSFISKVFYLPVFVRQMYRLTRKYNPPLTSLKVAIIHARNLFMVN